MISIELHAAVQNVHMFLFRNGTSSPHYDGDMKILVAEFSRPTQHVEKQQQRLGGPSNGNCCALRAASCACLTGNVEEPTIIPSDTARDRRAADLGHLFQAGCELPGLPLRDSALRNLGDCRKLGLRQGQDVLANET